MPTNKYAHFKLGVGVYFSVGIVDGHIELPSITIEDKNGKPTSIIILTCVENDIPDNNPADYVWNNTLDRDDETIRLLDNRMLDTAKDYGVQASELNFVIPKE